MSFEEDQPGEPATIPPPGDPDKAWRSAFMREVKEVRDEVKELRGEVRELSKIARKCFDELIKVSAENRDLKTRLEIVEARITLKPPDNHGTDPSAAA